MFTTKGFVTTYDPQTDRDIEDFLQRKMDKK